MCKKFLKPNKTKVILFVVIMLILFALPIVPVKIEVICLVPPCNPVDFSVSVYELFRPSTIFTTMTYLSIAIQMIIAYLISCSISIFAKLRK